MNTQSGKTTKLFITKTEPFCLNVNNKTKTFFVGTRGKAEVKIYDNKGKVLKTVTTVGSPIHIAVCRSTGKAAIACYDKGVVVMDSKFDRLYHMYTYPTNGTTIHANGAEFDGAGHILVADFREDEVHIANAATGNGLKQIKVDGGPRCLFTQHNGDIVVGTLDPNQLLTMTYLG